MVSNNMYKKLAKLVIKKGVNVQNNQPLIITANIRDIEFVRMCTKEAYEAGAKYVSVLWEDEELDRMDFTYQSIETLQEVPQWSYDRMKSYNDAGACYLTIDSSKPDYLKDMDSAKISATQQAYYEKMSELSLYRINNEGQWCIICLPSREWASMIFPNLPIEEAYEKLGDEIFKITRVSEDNDPIKEWEEHDKELIEHANILTSYNFKSLHFTSELGTDINIDLVRDHIWVGGGASRPDGVYFDCNMPTEECFSMPVKTGVNGVVYASKPLSHNGKVVEDFWFKFEDGKVVDFGAKKEEAVLKEMFDVDEGSRYLGEVALVPYDSPISKSNILFFNTLYDENAACHLAFGRPYPENLKNGVNMTKEELVSHGANDSMIHVDFMFGTKEMNIDGIQEDGTIIPIFREGNFVF